MHGCVHHLSIYDVTQQIRVYWKEPQIWRHVARLHTLTVVTVAAYQRAASVDDGKAASEVTCSHVVLILTTTAAEVDSGAQHSETSSS